MGIFRVGKSKTKVGGNPNFLDLEFLKQVFGRSAVSPDKSNNLKSLRTQNIPKNLNSGNIIMVRLFGGVFCSIYQSDF